MDKKWIICIVIAIVLGLGLGVGFALLSQARNKTEDTELLSEKELAGMEENSIQQNMMEGDSIVHEDEINAVETANTEDNISPNAIIVKKVYYRKKSILRGM